MYHVFISRTLPWLLWLLPLLIPLIAWQYVPAASVRLADASDPGAQQGFEPLEEGDLGRFRWAAAEAQIQLRAGNPHGILVLRGAQAPGARIRLAVGAHPALVLPDSAGQIRRVSLLLPPSADGLGTLRIQISGDPPAVIEGRALSLALERVSITPLRTAPFLPPPIWWLLLSGLALLSGAVARLAGWTIRRAGLIAALSSALLALFVLAAPLPADALLRDLAFFLSAAPLWNWWLLSSLAALALWPLTLALFARLPHAGYPLARIVALLAITWLAWALAVAGILPFGAPALVGLTIAAALLAWAGVAIGRIRLRPVDLRLRHILGWELLFCAGLFAGSRLRWFGAVGPALTGTEKPMEIAMLGAVMRGGFFPPIDPWFAGYGLNYYYLGYVGIGGMGLLSGVTPAVAFNLGFALIVALTLVATAYLGFVLVPQQGRRPLIGAALAVLLALVVGSQSAALQVLVGSPRWRALDSGQLFEALQQRLQGADPIQLSRPTPPSWDGPPFDTLAVAEQPFDWFQASRAIADDVALPDGTFERRYAITEFPAFSFYLGDLHPHVLAMPLNLAALALALALAREPTRLRVLGAGALAGALYCVNAWDAPIYALLLLGGVLLGQRSLHQRLSWRELLRDGVLFGAAAGLAALPFLLTFVPPAGPLRGSPIEQLPLLGRLSAAFGIAANRTNLLQFLALFGLPLIPIVALLLHDRAGSRLLGPLLLALSILIGPLIGFPLLVLLPLALLAARAAWCAGDPAAALLRWIIAVGALALLVPELVYLRDHLEGEMSRMITIFKFVYQAWLLWAIAAAAAIVTLVAAQPPARRLLWLLPTLLLLLGALIYPYGLLRWAEPWRPAERTYDGLAFLARESPDELAAAAWLAANVAPTQVVLSGYCTCDYELVSRIAAISAAPTLLGWMDGHERVWRSGDPTQLAEIAAREQAIARIFSEPAAAPALLAAYQVDFVYIGPVERRLYRMADLAQLTASLEPVFTQGQVAVYRVR